MAKNKNQKTGKNITKTNSITSKEDFTYRFNAFISYRHNNRQKYIARRLQNELHNFAKPWYSIRAVRLYRDETNLAIDPHLWRQIENALNNSEFLMLIASPESAASKWVAKELNHWLENRGSESILIVLTNGNLEWNSDDKKFDSTKTNAIPSFMFSAFEEEPLWVDLTWVKENDQDRQLDNLEFQDVVASISSKLRNIEKDLISGEDIKQKKRTMQIAISAICLITLFAVTSIFVSIGLFEQKKQTTEQRDEARARLLSAEGHRRLSVNNKTGIPYFLSSLNIRVTPNAMSGLFQNLQDDPHIGMQILPIEHPAKVAAIRSDINTAVLGLENGDIMLWNLFSSNSDEGEIALLGKQRTISLKHKVPGISILDIAISDDGRYVTSLSALKSNKDDDEGIYIFRWTLKDGKLVSGMPKLLKKIPISISDVAPTWRENSLEATLSGNGKTAVVATWDKGIIVWEEGKEEKEPIKLPNQAAGGAISLSEDGQKFVSVVANNTSPVIYNLSDSSIMELPRHNCSSAPISLQMSQNNKYVVGGTMQGTTIIWELGTQPRFLRCIDHPKKGAPNYSTEVFRVNFDETSNYLATYYRKRWHLWHLETGTLVGHPINAEGLVSAYAKGPKLMISTHEKTIQIIDHSLKFLRYWACSTSRREIPINEWKDLIGENVEYVQACPK